MSTITRSNWRNVELVLPTLMEVYRVVHYRSRGKSLLYRIGNDGKAPENVKIINEMGFDAYISMRLKIDDSLPEDFGMGFKASLSDRKRLVYIREGFCEENDLRFRDGEAFVRLIDEQHYEKGNLAKVRENQQVRNQEGYLMTIEKYISANNVTVRFPGCGLVVENQRYTNFESGKITNYLHKEVFDLVLNTYKFMKSLHDMQDNLQCIKGCYGVENGGNELVKALNFENIYSKGMLTKMRIAQVTDLCESMLRLLSIFGSKERYLYYGTDEEYDTVEGMLNEHQEPDLFFITDLCKLIMNSYSGVNWVDVKIKTDEGSNGVNAEWGNAGNADVVKKGNTKKGVNSVNCVDSHLRELLWRSKRYRTVNKPKKFYSTLDGDLLYVLLYQNRGLGEDFINFVLSSITYSNISELLSNYKKNRKFIEDMEKIRETSGKVTIKMSDGTVWGSFQMPGVDSDAELKYEDVLERWEKGDYERIKSERIKREMEDSGEEFSDKMYRDIFGGETQVDQLFDIAEDMAINAERCE